MGILMKLRGKNSYEPVSEQGYKKAYLLRQVEEKEAKQRIREFDEFDEPNKNDYPEPEDS